MRADQVQSLFESQRRRLWGLAYRLTGSTADADDVVQETFVRLVAQAPARDVDELGPWLVRVATNLGIDTLRRRRRRAYDGAWLPSPVETVDVEQPDAETRYGMAESVTFAFLVALEALGPRQRAVLILRDVLGWSARETAELLGGTEGSVRVMHLRARAALAAYDQTRCQPTSELQRRHRAALERLVTCLATQDAAGLEELLAESVRTVTDAGGEFTALKAPMSGRAAVARFYLTAARNRREGGPVTRIVTVNGLPALLITLARPVRRQAPRTLLRCELDDAGAIRVVHTILSSRKLSAVPPG